MRNSLQVSLQLLPKSCECQCRNLEAPWIGLLRYTVLKLLLPDDLLVPSC